MVFLVIGPAFLAARGPADAPPEVVTAAARHAWHVGMCAIVASGLFKLACSFVAGPIRRLIPRAALLGSLTAVALVLITFLPLLDVFESPLVGLLSLGIVLATLTARIPLPFGIPGALAALVVGWGIHLVGTGVGVAMDPLTWTGGAETWEAISISRTAVTALDAREGLIEPLDQVRASSLDPYATIRSAYRQRRVVEIRNQGSASPAATGTGFGVGTGATGGGAQPPLR
jgi:hypothetical protein